MGWFPMLAGIGHKVGQGSFGKVYVIDTDMGNLPGKEIPLAIKMELAKDGIKDSEVRNGMDLDHPNLIKVWDHSQVYSRRVMLMESASGGDLEKAHVQHSRQTRAKAMLEMFAAMHYLHQQGYTHSDFKGEQVMLSKITDGEGRVNLVGKLGDLGLSCQPTKKSYTCSDFAGTPYYIAPELAKAGRGRTYSNDMWSMGIALYRMMNQGKLPVFLQHCNTVEQLIRKIKMLTQSDVRLPNFNNNLDVLIKGLLNVNPKFRFDSGEALANAQKWAALEGVSQDVIENIVQGSLDGKRQQLSAAWGTCQKQQCHLGQRNRCEDSTCVYPCKVSTSHAGPSCRTCEAPRSRKAVNHCASCNYGFEVVGTRCQAIKEERKPVFMNAGQNLAGLRSPFGQRSPVRNRSPVPECWTAGLGRLPCIQPIQVGTSSVLMGFFWLA